MTQTHSNDNEMHDFSFIMSCFSSFDWHYEARRAHVPNDTNRIWLRIMGAGVYTHNSWCLHLSLIAMTMRWTPGRWTLACQQRVWVTLRYTGPSSPVKARYGYTHTRCSLFSQKNRAGKNSKLFPKIWQTTRPDHTHMHRCAAHTQTRAAPRISARVRCQVLFWAQSLWQHRSTSVCHDLTHKHKHHITSRNTHL